MRLIDADNLKKRAYPGYHTPGEVDPLVVEVRDIDEQPTVDAFEAVSLKEAIRKALLINCDTTRYRYELGKACLDAFLDDCVKYARIGGKEKT